MMLALRSEPATLGVEVGASIVLPPSTPHTLRDHLFTSLALPNPAYANALRHGTRTLPDERLYWVEQLGDGSLRVPRGAWREVQSAATATGISLAWDNQTTLGLPVSFQQGWTLSEAQQLALSAVVRKSMGVLVAPAGSGKTVIGLAAVAARRQPTLWLTHTRELAIQTAQRASEMLGMAPEEIGMFGDGRKRIGDRLTIGLVQTLVRDVPAELISHVGHVIVDECHHMPSLQMTAVVQQLPARYLLGLSATPFRRDRLDKAIHWLLGPLVHRIEIAALADRLIAPHIIRCQTLAMLESEEWSEMMRELIGDVQRSEQIVQDVLAARQAGRRCLVLSDRIEHAESLAAAINARGMVCGVLHGSLPTEQRQFTVAALRTGALQCVAATGSLVGEGFDVPALDALFLATPVSWAGKLEQYLGRVSRTAPGKDDALVYDYVDGHGMLKASWYKRLAVYRRLGCRVG